MESRPLPKNQETNDRPKGQPRKPLRFRLIRLEERIAPAKGGGNTWNPKCFVPITVRVEECNALISQPTW